MKRKVIPKMMLLTMILAMMISISIPIYAAESENETDGDIKVEKLDPSDGITEIYDEENGEMGLFSTKVNIAWSIGNKARKYSGKFYKKAGSTLKIDFKIKPGTQKVKAGYLDGTENKYFVTATSSVTKTFKIKKSENIRVFVENSSGKSVVVTGYYEK